MITFENVLEIVTKLSREQQEMLIEIVRKRMIEARRQEILTECQEALAEYRNYLLKLGKDYLAKFPATKH